MNLLTQIRSLFEPVLAAVAPDPAKVSDYLAMVKPAGNPQHGDYQANFTMSLAGAMKSPKEAAKIAREITAKLPPNDMLDEPAVESPKELVAFINLRLKSGFLAKAVQQIATDPKLGV